MNRAASAILLAWLAAPWASPSAAREGMYPPEQLPAIAGDLRRAGLALDPAALTDLTGFPMGAVAILGHCSASFVSPNGLIATNHHCARGDVQYISSPAHNYLETGFFAPDTGAERPADPGTHVYVTVAVSDVTRDVVGGLGEPLSGAERYARIEDREKGLVQRCEADPGHRCRVTAFFGGLQYKLIKRLDIRDVRLAYAPADSIGRYGGDIDNWAWPRHTGDFSFFRAYVAPDGSPADYSKDNVPYRPKHYLKVAARGVEDGDFVMALGYPGSTSRYVRLAEVRQAFGWSYPTVIALWKAQIATIEAAAPARSEARIKYESRLAGLANGLKNREGQLAGARRAHLIERSAERDGALRAWVAQDPSRRGLAEAIGALDLLAEERARAARASFWYDQATSARLLSVAQTLYRLAKERQKPDAERESGYQERDLASLREGFAAIERRYDPAVDKAEWLLFLESYMVQPAASRVAALDRALGLPAAFDKARVGALLGRYYAHSRLGDPATRLALMSAPPAALEASDDPFIRLAVALYATDHALEEAQKDRDGRDAALRPRYTEALIAWRKAQGLPTWPDANSTLRLTYGKVGGGSPQDGLIYEPFTRLEGIAQKDTGAAPFDAPARELSLIKARDYGGHAAATLGTVPVDFLADLDITGGNSGSPTLNARGELVGLLFDTTLEGVNSDWLFNPRATRSIHVDARYMLWVLGKVDGARRLIDEMEIAK